MYEINFLKTRSFWMIAGAVVTAFTGLPPEVVQPIAMAVASDTGADPEALTGIESGINTLVPVLLGVSAYGERIMGKRKVVFRKERV